MASNDSINLQATFGLNVGGKREIKLQGATLVSAVLMCARVCRGRLWGRHWRVCVLPLPPQFHLFGLCPWLQLCVFDWFYRSVKMFYCISATVHMFSKAPLVSANIWMLHYPGCPLGVYMVICTMADRCVYVYLKAYIWEAPLNCSGNNQTGSVNRVSFQTKIAKMRTDSLETKVQTYMILLE